MCIVFTNASRYLKFLFMFTLLCTSVILIEATLCKRNRRKSYKNALKLKKTYFCADCCTFALKTVFSTNIFFLFLRPHCSCI